jgi:hypothetical protein
MAAMRAAVSGESWRWSHQARNASAVNIRAHPANEATVHVSAQVYAISADNARFLTHFVASMPDIMAEGRKNNVSQ